MRSFAALLVLLLPFTAAANGGKDHGTFTRHKSESYFMVTAERRFSIEIELEGGVLRVGVNRGEIVVHDSHDRDVKGAAVTVSPRMMETAQDVPEKPIVDEDEGLFGSRYRVENLVIGTGGHWELRVTVEKDGVADTAVFDFPDVTGAGR